MCIEVINAEAVIITAKSKNEIIEEMFKGVSLYLSADKRKYHHCLRSNLPKTQWSTPINQIKIIDAQS